MKAIISWLIVFIVMTIYTAGTSSQYFAGDTGMTFNAATAYCQSIGTTLASVHSQTEQNAILQTCTDATAPNSANCWFGLTGYPTFSWVDATTTDYGFNSNSGSSATYSNPPWQSSLRDSRYPCTMIWYGQWWNPKADCGWQGIPICVAPSDTNTADYEYIGCFVDTGSRALRYGPHTYGYTIESCHAACASYTYFALQAGGWCFCENDYDHATKYGTANTCPDNKLGGAWGNDLFRNAIPTALPTESPSNNPTISPTTLPTESPTLDGCDFDVDAYLNKCYCDSTSTQNGFHSAQIASETSINNNFNQDVVNSLLLKINEIKQENSEIKTLLQITIVMVVMLVASILITVCGAYYRNKLRMSNNKKFYGKVINKVDDNNDDNIQSQNDSGTVELATNQL